MLIKVCGMTEQPLIDLAAALGVDMCGFVFYPPSPRYISPPHAAEMDTRGMKRVGVFVDQSVKETLAIARLARLDYVQLHGKQGADFAKAFPPEQIIRVLFPRGYARLTDMQEDVDRLFKGCGMFLLDAGRGSGRTLDWGALAGVRFPRPWLLAGGLSHENIVEALSQCRPYGIDMNSRLEDGPGHKSAALLAKAVAAVRNR